MNNEYLIDGGKAFITVESSKYGRKIVVIDEADVDRLKDLTVYVWGTKRHRSLYAMVTLPGNKQARLHRLIMQPRRKELVDHRNGDCLDNTRANLRVTDSRGNNSNAQKRNSARTSRYKGTHFSKRERKWKAQIQVNKKKISLGTYATELEAAIAYNEAAIIYHGEFAKLNDFDKESN